MGARRQATLPSSAQPWAPAKTSSQASRAPLIEAALTATDDADEMHGLAGALFDIFTENKSANRFNSTTFVNEPWPDRPDRIHAATESTAARAKYKPVGGAILHLIYHWLRMVANPDIAGDV